MNKNYLNGSITNTRNIQLLTFLSRAIISIIILISVFSGFFQLTHVYGPKRSIRLKLQLNELNSNLLQIKSFLFGPSQVKSKGEIANDANNHAFQNSVKPDIYERENSVDSTGAYKEYEDICALMLDIWSNYQKNEVFGFITNNGNMIITSIGDIWKVHGPKPILYEDRYYLPWNKKKKLKSNYKGAIQYSGSDYIFLPVKAMFHTHVLSGKLSQEDLSLAGRFKDIRHLLIERSGISEFDDRGVKKVYRGNIFNLCDLVQN